MWFSDYEVCCVVLFDGVIGDLFVEKLIVGFVFIEGMNYVVLIDLCVFLIYVVFVVVCFCLLNDI